METKRTKHIIKNNDRTINILVIKSSTNSKGLPIRLRLLAWKIQTFRKLIGTSVTVINELIICIEVTQLKPYLSQPIKLSDAFVY